MHLLRLSGRKVAEHVKTKGLLWKGKHFYVRWFKGAPRNVTSAIQGGLYVGTVTSAKLDKSAVRRNRMRRRCREALRLSVKNNQDNITSAQLLILPRSSSLSCDFRELSVDADQFLSRLTLCQTPK